MKIFGLYITTVKEQRKVINLLNEITTHGIEVRLDDVQIIKCKLSNLNDICLLHGVNNFLIDLRSNDKVLH